MSAPTRSARNEGVNEATAPAMEVGIMPMDLGVRAKLSVMMFLQYFVWGVWFVTMGTYLSKTLRFQDDQLGWAYAASPIGAMVAPFFVGMIADRFFATQRILAVLHFAGGLVLFAAAQAEQFSQFFPLILLYFFCYMPTLALTNSISFRHMSSPEQQFPGVRVLGTIGWIAAGLLVGAMAVEDQNLPLQMGGAASIVLALYCLALPHTPPANTTQRVTARDVLGLDALNLMKIRPFAIFAVSSFLICIPLQFYYGMTNVFLNEINFPRPAGTMTIGQMSEIFFMLVMPLFFARLGVKYMLLVGMLAWSVRYVLFALGADGPQWMLYLGIALHGICYDFFFVTGYIYVDKKAGAGIRASAQGLITFITWGMGGFIGSILWGRVGNYYKLGPEPTAPHNWYSFWMVPAIFAFVVLVFFALLFYDKVDSDRQTAAS
ncbi:MAG TPA: nucleoside permease [Pirellulales bacterium]|jgi:nucleoside transporter|nr:nucleoside permease [Pirellulales bacterium]